MRRGSQRRVVCGLNTHGCKPVLRNALGLGLEHDSGGVAMPLSKRSQDAPEPLSKWSGRVPRSVCGWNAWGISTLPAFALENTREHGTHLFLRCASSP